MKWFFISICFARPWNSGFLVIVIDDLLSSNITVVISREFPGSVRTCLSQIDSWPALYNAMYFASAVEQATHFCFLLLHNTAPPVSINSYPDVDLLSFVSPAQSASLNPIHAVASPLLYRVPYCTVPIENLSNRLRVVQCSFIDFDESLALVLAATMCLVLYWWVNTCGDCSLPLFSYPSGCWIHKHLLLKSAV